MSNLKALYQSHGYSFGAVKELVLPSGLNATVRSGVGQDSVNAARMADGDPALTYPALMATLATINGQKFAMEAYLEMPKDDFDALIMALAPAEEKNVESSPALEK